MCMMCMYRCMRARVCVYVCACVMRGSVKMLVDQVV